MAIGALSRATVIARNLFNQGAKGSLARGAVSKGMRKAGVRLADAAGDTITSIV